MFAKRDFRRGEKIMIDKYLMKQATDQVSSYARWAVAQLSPRYGSWRDKFENNTWGRGMYGTGSRINHACIGNCGMTPLTDTDTGATAFFAIRDIPAEEEITVSYVRLSSNRYLHNPPRGIRNRRVILRQNWGFDCECGACTDPALIPLVEEVERLNVRIDRYWEGPSGFLTDLLYLRDSRRLIELYGQLQMSPERFMFTYFDMFQVAIRYSKTVDEGCGFIALAHENMMKMNAEKPIKDGTDCFKVFMNDPKSHSCYLMNE